jgi:hypothetical protein
LRLCSNQTEAIQSNNMPALPTGAFARERDKNEEQQCNH